MSQPHKAKGYHRLAQLMGRSGDLAIFRKFHDLNMLSLLSLQAELIDLRADFYNICEDDERGGEEFSLSFSKLLESKDAENNFQYETLVEIRSKLAEYSEEIPRLALSSLANLLDTDELLVQVAGISTLQSPSRSNYSTLRKYLRDPQGGNNFLEAREASTWRSDYFHDLVALQKPNPDRDTFTTWLVSYPVKLYHGVWGHKEQGAKRNVIDEETGMIEYEEKRLEKVGQIISTTLASALPMLAILGLYFEKDLLKRIYIAMGITMAFSAVLSVFTKARRIEIFTATAGLAAVEVVFICSTELKR